MSVPFPSDLVSNDARGWSALQVKGDSHHGGVDQAARTVRSSGRVDGEGGGQDLDGSDARPRTTLVERRLRPHADRSETT
jgi:hypothetical protein